MPKEPSEKFLTLFDRWIVSIGQIMSLGFLLCAAIIIFEILSRYIFNSPTFWVHETTVFISSILFLFSGAFTLAKNRHIRITMLYDMLLEKWKNYANIFIVIISTMYSLAMLFATFVVAKSAILKPWGEFYLETSGTAWDPPFPAIIKLFLFLVLFTIFIQSILHLIVYIKRIKSV